ncbi:MAG: two-component system alkaline phosphatase synthesis response regulator PhoP [Flavobacteriaceae bacterium]|jgi:two-component system alkaline phosphatase synthesis response regulator PhoP
MKHICVVEDEASLAEMIQLNLELEGFNVTTYRDGGDALVSFEADLNYDLIVLDVMLPRVNGVDLCKAIRKKSAVPVLFLSAKGTTTDRIEGLKAGANDYLPKPFDLEELLLRVAVLTNQFESKSVTIGKLIVDFKTYIVEHIDSGETQSLSKKEVGLIQLFCERQGQVVSRSEILDRVWGKDQFPTTRTIDNFILNFRKIFEKDPKNPLHFLSIRGVGYKFVND